MNIDYSKFTDVDEVKALIKENKNDKKEQPNHDMPFTYAKPAIGNIFSNIIIFTNNRDPKENKTLANIYQAIDNIKKSKCDIIPELYVFVAAKSSIDNEEKITIEDDKTTLVIDKQSNTNTIVFSRLGVQGENECEKAVEMLSDHGFLILNPLRYSELASNKYETACLLEKGNIPQPKFTLMTKEFLYDEKEYNERMKSIYKEWKGEGDKDEKLEFVVKILDGHGGTGVMLLNGKNIKAVLQTLYAVCPELELIIQKKEEADGGDIRVHVLTLRDKQVILGAMKRVKIKSDFRSNVSLGAEAEPVKLTPEQEKIAIETSKLSRLPWCAVDIMPLVKGSNKEIGDNVVLEINASPGTDGISEVLDYNFINILLNELQDPKQFVLQNKRAGYKERVEVFIEKDSKPIVLLAKLDTGNGTQASTIEVGALSINNNTITFSFEGVKYKVPIKNMMKVKSNSTETERPVIDVYKIRIGMREVINTQIAVVENRNRSTNALINRDILSELGYMVDSSEPFILSPEIEKVNII